MQARLIRGFVAMPFTSFSPADASSHRLADDVNGGVLRYMAPAMEPEQAAYSLSPPLSGAFLADPDPMLVRLIRGFIAMAFAARVLTKDIRISNRYISILATRVYRCVLMH